MYVLLHEVGKHRAAQPRERRVRRDGKEDPNHYLHAPGEPIEPTHRPQQRTDFPTEGFGDVRVVMVGVDGGVEEPALHVWGSERRGRQNDRAQPAEEERLLRA